MERNLASLITPCSSLRYQNGIENIMFVYYYEFVGEEKKNDVHGEMHIVLLG